jgi:hypothetical protein
MKIYFSIHVNVCITIIYMYVCFYITVFYLCKLNTQNCLKIKNEIISMCYCIEHVKVPALPILN